MSQEDTSKNLNPLPLSTRPSVDTNPEHTSLKYLLQSIFNPIFNSILKPIHKPILKSMFESSWINWIAILIITVCPFIHYFIVACNSNPIYIDLIRSIISLTVVFFIVRIVVSAYNSKELITNFFKNHPLQLFVSIIACGATTAFFLPLILNLFKFIGETDKLTTALLASTGGVIAVFTLIKTHQKNQTDEATLKHNKAVHAQQIKDRNEDIERQISEREEQKKQFDKNFDLQSSKNKQDHIHQAHTERRSRYTKAVEQLAHEKAAIRLGGIYTLVGLIDEWLADKSIKNEDDRRKEGQVIINNLCAYIQSPFKLAAKAKELEADTAPATYDKEQFIADQAELHEEQNVRRTIFDEISKRSSTIEDNNAKIFTPIPGAWSNFDFNFSRAPIFYPLNNLTIEKGNFTSAKFYGNADFAEVFFTEKADFSGAGFTQEASFKDATFAQEASFKDATFTQNVFFNGATFTQEASFKDATFTQNVFFNGATFTQNVYFLGTTFTQDAYFVETTFAQDTYFLDATFTLIADFTKAIFTQKVYSSRVVFPKQVYFVEATFTQDVYFVGATFSQNASFNGASFIQKAGFSGTTFAQEAFFFGATFAQDADFNGATFTQDADFNGATFTQNADFSSAIFTQKADFRWAAFTKEVNFSNATFSQNVDFGVALFENYVPTFVKGNLRAQFSVHSAQEDYNFSVRSGSKPIPPGKAELDGIKRKIPVGTVLFDPDSGRTSDPAKPIEESDSQGGNPSK